MLRILRMLRVAGRNGLQEVCRVGLVAAAAPGLALAAPSAPPCEPDPGDGVEARPGAYVVDYIYTGGGAGESWSDPDNWSFGSWAEEAADNAGVPAVDDSATCLNAVGDASAPFTSYPRAIVDGGRTVLITGPIPPVGELEIGAGSTVFLQTDLAELVSDFGNGDVGGSVAADGLLIVGAGTSTPLPGAALGPAGILRLGQGATVTAEADAGFTGSGTIEMLGATLEVTDEVAVDVFLQADAGKNEIRGVPGGGFQSAGIDGDASVDASASLDLGIGMDRVDIGGLFTVEGQLFLRAGQTAVEPDFGTLVAASPAGRIATQQDSDNPAVDLLNEGDLFVQTGATLAITGTPGPFDPAEVRLFNELGGVLVVQEGGLVTTEGPPAGPVPFVTSFGRLDLGGDIRGTLRSPGVLRIGVPASDPDIATLTGDLELFVNSQVLFDLEGRLPGDEHDQLIVGGTVSLDGTLDLEPGLFFTPGPGDGYALIEAASVTGSFDAVSDDLGLPLTVEPTRVFLGGDPRFPDTGDWLLPGNGAVLRNQEVRLCLDEAGLHFDLVLGLAEGYDFLALRLSTEEDSAFSEVDESVALNTFARSGEPDPSLPQPAVVTDPGYAGPDRLADGPLAGAALVDLGDGFFRFRGVAPSGTQPFQGGDVLGSIATRATTDTPSDPPPQDGLGFPSLVYAPPSFAELLTITERPVCVRLPEPGGPALAAAVLAALGCASRLRRRVGRGG